jgi:hypothetical protein
LDIGNWAGKLGRQGRKHHVEMGITSKDVFIPGAKIEKKHIVVRIQYDST